MLPCDTAQGTSNCPTCLFTLSSKAQRQKEFSSKVHEAVSRVLGDRLADMVSVSALATRPECQGRGYASALIRVATALVRVFRPSLPDRRTTDIAAG